MRTINGGACFSFGGLRRRCSDEMFDGSLKCWQVPATAGGLWAAEDLHTLGRVETVEVARPSHEPGGVGAAQKHREAPFTRKPSVTGIEVAEFSFAA